ncbi:MAG: hypothetical protein CL931_15480 [Deltaproteobacteria bacterium]|nr:hypothetical protein [Deltaproteobacteria bacterium]
MYEANSSAGGAAAPPIGGLRRIAARFVWGLHVAVIAFLLVGWALPWPAAWWTYAIGAPFVQVGWILFDDYCWLSILEARLRREPLVKETEEGQEQRAFVAEFLESILGRPVPKRLSNAISYGVLWGGFAIACARLCFD